MMTNELAVKPKFPVDGKHSTTVIVTEWVLKQGGTIKATLYNHGYIQTVRTTSTFDSPGQLITKVEVVIES